MELIVIIKTFRTFCLFCMMAFLILKFLFGDAINEWYKKGRIQKILVRTFGLFAICGCVFFMIDVIIGRIP